MQCVRRPGATALVSHSSGLSGPDPALLPGDLNIQRTAGASPNAIHCCNHAGHGSNGIGRSAQLFLHSGEIQQRLKTLILDLNGMALS